MSLSDFSRSNSDRSCCISPMTTRLDDRFEGEDIASDLGDAVLGQSASSRVDILSRVGESETRVMICVPRALEERLRLGVKSGNGDDNSCAVAD